MRPTSLFSLPTRNILYTSTLLLMFCCNALAEKGNTIIWAVGNFPPRLVVDEYGGLGGQAGIQLGILETGMSGYQHQYQVMTYQGFAQSLREQAPVCSSLLFKTPEREQLAWFSKALNISLQPQLVIRTRSYKQLGSPEKVSLAELIQNDDFIGGFEQHRSYAKFDEILQPRKKQANIVYLDVSSEKLMAMLNAGTVDYTIEYAYRARYLQQLSNFDASRFSFVDIEEGFGYAFSYVSCPKNDWGKAVVEAANKVIEVERKKPGYLQLIQMIYTDEKRKQLLADIYYKHFLTSD